MTDPSGSNKERNRKIAQNEETRQVTGSIRVSSWAIAVAVAIGAIVFALIWIAAKR